MPRLAQRLALAELDVPAAAVVLRRSSAALLLVAVALLGACGSGGSTSPRPTGSPSADPAPSTASATTRAAPRVEVGFSLGELVGASPLKASSLLDLAQAAGASVIRFDVSWAAVQPVDAGHHDWGPLDAAFSAVRGRGLEVLPVIGYTPAWARPPGCGQPTCGPRDPELFAAFVAEAAHRYGAHGVAAWEVWNEPNTTWRPAPDPTAYARVLDLASSAVHGQAPGATVLLGGLAPGQTRQSGPWSPADFVAAVDHAGGEGAYQGVAVHPYSFPALPGEDPPWSGWTQMLAVHAGLVARGEGDRDVWVTEFGAPTTGDGPQATLGHRSEDTHPDHVDERLQAATVTSAFDQLAGAPWLRSLVWYSVEDLTGAEGQANLGGYGLVTSSGRRKLAFGAWQVSARRELGGSR